MFDPVICTVGSKIGNFIGAGVFSQPKHFRIFQTSKEVQYFSDKNTANIEILGSFAEHLLRPKNIIQEKRFK